ncbi:NADPH-dependent FMN reductase [Edaphobacillus lindanitolerans]|uniref:FMN reductase n=1 Tax=Edaphobacillus lindanitolerans TaxID=550447 RepID=A0A1U7PQZ2_9BACI|nr:NADPH-dependent FMN reductase [Edaphobacillus lindanitolerans]SIT92656.1 FMN reductase [Edaphobacillus lindanitolerans]
MNVIALSGSTVGSKTRTAVEAAASRLKNANPQHDVTVMDLAELQIAFSDGRDYRDYGGDTSRLAEAIMAADALIIGTPVFQASIPGTLKNVFDLLPVNAFRDKTVSIIVTAGSAKHYLVAEQQLKPILSYMKAQIVPTYVFIEEKDFIRDEIINDDIHFRLDRLAEDTLLFAEAYAKIREEKDAAYDF